MKLGQHDPIGHTILPLVKLGHPDLLNLLMNCYDCHCNIIKIFELLDTFKNCNEQRHRGLAQAAICLTTAGEESGLASVVVCEGISFARFSLLPYSWSYKGILVYNCDGKPSQK